VVSHRIYCLPQDPPAHSKISWVNSRHVEKIKDGQTEDFSSLGFAKQARGTHRLDTGYASESR
jgi:hypothetical protein